MKLPFFGKEVKFLWRFSRARVCVYWHKRDEPLLKAREVPKEDDYTRFESKIKNHFL